MSVTFQKVPAFNKHRRFDRCPVKLTDRINFGTEPCPCQLELAIAELLRAVESALTDEFDAAQLSVQRAADFLQIKTRSVTSLAQIRAPDSEPRKGGLAPWQIRRVSNYIAEKLRWTVGCLINTSQQKLPSNRGREDRTHSPERWALVLLCHKYHGIIVGTSQPGLMPWRNFRSSRGTWSMCARHSATPTGTQALSTTVGR